MSEYGEELEGDNIEFTAVNIDDYTIWLSMTGIDTETTKFTTKPLSAKNLSIRIDKNSDLVQENNTVFTNPITMVADKEHVEKRNGHILSKIVIRTNATNTKIKVRWF